MIREFHVLGDAVNVAARLKARAPLGAIYIGPETRREAGDDFECRELGRLKLKGKSVEVSIFELVRSLERRAGRGLSRPTRACVAPRRPRTRAGAFSRPVSSGSRAGTRRRAPRRRERRESGKSRLLAEADALPVARRIATVHACAQAPLRELLADLLEALDAGARLAAELAGRRRSRCGRGGPGRRDAASAAAGRAARRRARGSAARRSRVARSCCRALIASAASRAACSSSSRCDPDGASDARATAGRWARAERDGRSRRSRRRRAARWSTAEAAEPLAADVARARCSRGAPAIPARLLLGDVPRAGAARRARARRHERARERHRAASRDDPVRRHHRLHGDDRADRRRARLSDRGRLPAAARRDRAQARRHRREVPRRLRDGALRRARRRIEDAPRAAVNAAIEMRRARAPSTATSWAATSALDVHSGINTGLGIAGDISGPLIREFAVMGEPGERRRRAEGPRAARARSTSATRSTARRATCSSTASSSPASSDDDGERRAAPSSCSRSRSSLHRARIGAERRLFSRLVGRERELALLRGALGAAARRRRAASSSVIAEAGLGKSRLLAELAASDEARELAWREGRSLSTGQHHELPPDRRPAAAPGRRSATTTTTRSARAKLDAAIRRTLPDEADDVLPFIATLLGLPLERGRQRAARRDRRATRSRS